MKISLQRRSTALYDAFFKVFGNVHSFQLCSFQEIYLKTTVTFENLIIKSAHMFHVLQKLPDVYKFVFSIKMEALKTKTFLRTIVT